MRVHHTSLGAERNAFLVRVARGDPHASLDLARRLREVAGVGQADAAPSTAQRRRIQDLLAGGAEYKRCRQEREQAEARQARIRHLETLEKNEAATWERVYALIDEKKASAYDQATQLLGDLRDLAHHRKRDALFQSQLNDIVRRYANRSALLRRFKEKQL